MPTDSTPSAQPAEETPDPPADIEIVRRGAFTTATVAGRFVAVMWGDAVGGPHYVSDGTGPGERFDTRALAIPRLVCLAVDADVVQSTDAGTPTDPPAPMKQTR